MTDITATHSVDCILSFILNQKRKWKKQKTITKKG